MGLINYHTHTPLCGHATGETEDYIRAAVKRNFTELGFSDHAPLPEDLRKGVTMEPGELEGYLDELVRLRDLYRGRIAVRIGLEVDFPLRDTFDPKYFHDPRMDFIMGSCHFIGRWPFDQEPYREEFKNRDIDEAYASYYALVEGMAESARFDIIGHFDIIKKFGYRPAGDFGPLVERIAKKLSRAGTAVEINTSGLMKPVKEMYPSDGIIAILFDNSVPVTLGSDCHDPETVDYMLAQAVEKLKKTGYRKVSGFAGRKRHDISIYDL